MSNKSVTVLAPNGRRQTVKVTPNTTILQILEEVCGKQGFKAEQYDITHHNKVLDATSIMRYTGLPNNAQLEMAEAQRTRAETQVKVGLALESGDRLMGEFQPLDTLWHVVETLCPDEAEVDESAGILPVIFYMGREESGIENLKSTTLRSLGLTSGGAILRFFKKTLQELHRQANVSAPLSRPVVVAPGTLLKPSTNDLDRASALPKRSKTEQLTSSQSSDSEAANGNSCQAIQSQGMSDLSVSTTNDESICPSVSLSAETQKSENDMEMDYEDSSEASTHTSSLQSTSTLPPPAKSFQVPCSNVEPEETIIFLGERNAVLFDVATARACQPNDVPDDFFDLTFDDAKQLLRDLKHRKAAMEEQPLVTSQYRELERSKKMLNALNQYKRCVIKVQFPNQLVLQGTFTPLEKVSHVLQFVKKYLQDSTIDFDLFITPPKQILEAGLSLYDADCVPGALVHFSTSAPRPDNGSYIREDIMAQVSSISAAVTAASVVHQAKNASSSSSSAHTRNVLSTSDVIPQSVPVSKPSTSIQKESSSTDSEGKKVPKWFTTAKK